jgi:PAS domain S-box-containing protein
MNEQPVRSDAPSVRAVVDLLALSYEPILVWRFDGGIEVWNAGAERLYGFRPEEALGRVSHALLQTRFPIEFAGLTLQLQDSHHWAGELRHTCKDGREVVVDTRMQLLDDGTVLEVNRDVTEIKALAARQATLMRELSAAAAKFEALFDQSGIFAGIMDLQGYLREANNLSLEWCGYTREQVLDRPFWETPWWRGSEEVKARIRFATDQAATGHAFRMVERWAGADRGLRDASYSGPFGVGDVPASDWYRHHRAQAGRSGASRKRAALALDRLRRRLQ